MHVPIEALELRNDLLGAYVRLCCLAEADGLPDDPLALMAVAQLGRGMWHRYGARLIALARAAPPDVTPAPQEPESVIEAHIAGAARRRDSDRAKMERVHAREREGASQRAIARDPVAEVDAGKLLILLWNDHARRLPRAWKVGPIRRDRCAQRLRERPLGDWRAIFRKMNEVPFYAGNNARGWIATFDWITHDSDRAELVLKGQLVLNPPKRRARFQIDPNSIPPEQRRGGKENS